MPLFLVTTNVNIIINSGWLYNYGFSTYDIANRTGIENEELPNVARDIKRYFNSSEEPLQVAARVGGVRRDLFTEREVLHMADVKGLVRGVYLWQKVSFAVMAGMAIGLLAIVGRRRALSALGRGLMWGSGLTFVILILLGLGFLAGFDRLFNQFHLISFSNDLWRLSDSDFLIRLFPEEFFRDATLIVAGLTMGQAALTAGVVTLIRRRGNLAKRALTVGGEREAGLPAG